LGGSFLVSNLMARGWVLPADLAFVGAITDGLGGGGCTALHKSVALANKMIVARRM
jgi:hypothetical protein